MHLGVLFVSSFVDLFIGFAIVIVNVGCGVLDFWLLLVFTFEAFV